jgi:hypothetical protein
MWTAESIDWRQVVAYQGVARDGDDLFMYDQDSLEEFRVSVDTYVKNRTQEALNRVHDVQKIVFPFTLLLTAEQVMSIAHEMPVIDKGGEIAEDGVMNQQLVSPSQRRIKKIALKRGLCK